MVRTRGGDGIDERVLVCGLRMTNNFRSHWDVEPSNNDWLIEVGASCLICQPNHVACLFNLLRASSFRGSVRAFFLTHRSGI